MRREPLISPCSATQDMSEGFSLVIDEAELLALPTVTYGDRQRPAGGLPRTPLPRRLHHRWLATRGWRRHGYALSPTCGK